MFRALFIILISGILLVPVMPVFAQQSQILPVGPTLPVTDQPQSATTSGAVATSSAEEQRKIEQIQKDDITKPEQSEEKEEILTLFQKRPVFFPDPTNFLAFLVQHAVRAGVPANTLILILLVPFLATFVAFIRHILGFPSLEMLVPVTLSITLIATGLTAGMILLLTILIASFCSRIILKRIRIMLIPKMALSLLVVSLFVLLALIASASAEILIVKQLSIFPVLLFIILSDKIVALQLGRSWKEITSITAMTIIIGIAGYLLLSAEYLRDFIILYPEAVLLLIPINIIIGRYFGLRMTEYFRFSQVKDHGSK